jgi:hypothetical protein
MEFLVLQKQKRFPPSWTNESSANEVNYANELLIVRRQTTTRKEERICHEINQKVTDP